MSFKVLLAHGSSDQRHGEQVCRLANEVSKLLGEKVGTAFLGDHDLPQGATVLPLFLGLGKHVREDIPMLTGASDCHVLPSLGEHAEDIVDFVVNALSADTQAIHIMFALYQFSGFECLERALDMRGESFSKHAIGSLHAQPLIEHIERQWQMEGVDPISLQPMLLFEGKSMDRLRAMINPNHSNVTIHPVISEQAGFAALLADYFQDAHET